jgi:lysophospholipase L1-like esterase
MIRGAALAAIALLVAACATPAGSAVLTPAPSASTVPATTPPADVLRLVVLGDSIAVPAIGCGDCTGFDELYADYLETLTGRPVDLRNEARPGAQIEDLESLLDSNTVVQGEIANADIVVVSIGYNNGAPWDPDDPCHVEDVVTDADLIPAILAMTPECITDTIEKYRGELDTAYGRIAELAGDREQVRITFGVFDNIRDNPGSDGTLPNVSPEEMQPAIEKFKSIYDQWNAMDCEVATAHGFVCADLRHAFNGPDGNSSVGPYASPDWVHPNETGQAVMAELLERVDVSMLTDR